MGKPKTRATAAPTKANEAGKGKAAPVTTPKVGESPEKSTGESATVTMLTTATEGLEPAADPEVPASSGEVHRSTAEDAGEPTTPAPATVPDVLAAYPNLSKWPTSSGPMPTTDQIIAGRALGFGKGTKRELGVAAYFRPEPYTLKQVAEGLQAVFGGSYYEPRNITTDLEKAGVVNLIKEGQGQDRSFRLTLTEKGEAKVKEWRTANGCTV